MALLAIFILILVVSTFFFGARTIGLLVAMIGFAALTSSPVIGIGIMLLGVGLFFCIRT